MWWSVWHARQMHRCGQPCLQLWALQGLFWKPCWMLGHCRARPAACSLWTAFRGSMRLMPWLCASYRSGHVSKLPRTHLAHPELESVIIFIIITTQICCSNSLVHRRCYNATLSLEAMRGRPAVLAIAVTMLVVILHSTPASKKRKDRALCPSPLGIPTVHRHCCIFGTHAATLS